MTVEQGFIALGSILAALAVALGAFGAHALRRRLTPDRLETFETGVRYHMYHSLALLAAALVSSRFPSSPLAVVSGWLFVAGIILFSGSLYLLATARLRWLGVVTPLGGAAFILGWICLALSVLQG
ncbi:MAG: DUF423 domain-containing protein [Rudaea sp.]